MHNFSDKSLRVFQHAIPQARFQTYLDETQNLEGAVKLYLWNIKAASAVTQVSGLVEVLFRNTIDQKLQAWNYAKSNSTEWINSPSEPLKSIVRPTPPANWVPTPSKPLWHLWWEHRAEHTVANPCHHDLVAGLSFGTWTSILPSPSATSATNARLIIWENALKFGFNGERREAIHRWSHEIRLMRNRASHLRPMLDVAKLKKFHKYSIRILRSMDQDFGQIVAGLAYVPDIIKDKPT